MNRRQLGAKAPICRTPEGRKEPRRGKDEGIRSCFDASSLSEHLNAGVCSPTD